MPRVAQNCKAFKYNPSSLTLLSTAQTKLRSMKLAAAAKARLPELPLNILVFISFYLSYRAFKIQLLVK